MGINYFIACVECKLFIDLHKWPVIDELQDKLVHAYENKRSGNYIPEISHNPVVYFDSKKGLAIINTIQKESFYTHDYIKILSHTLKAFLKEHSHHTFILTCDMGSQPWEIGEPVWFEWKEIKSAFHFAAQFLPRNLVDDFELSDWNQVLNYYEMHEPWFLHDE